MNPDPIHSDDWESQVTAYVQGELSAGERVRFEAFMAESEICRLRVYEVRQVIGRLASAPDFPGTRDLRAELLAAVKAEGAAADRPVIRFPRLTLMKAAAVAALLVSGWLALVMTGKSPQEVTHERLAAGEAVRLGLDWLAAAQEPSGAWDGSRWGGSTRHTISLTGLAVMAMLQPGDEAGSVQHVESIRRAVTFLTAHQRPDGSFGSLASFDQHSHAIATCTLLEVYRKTRDPSLKPVLDRAIDRMRGDRWTASRERTGGPDETWRVMAFQIAGRLGWAVPAGGGVSGPEPETPSFKMKSGEMAAGEELYDLYMQSWHRALSGEKLPGEICKSLSANMIELQETTGESAGSWNLPGRYSLAGGRVFSTALAALTLSLIESDNSG